MAAAATWFSVGVLALASCVWHGESAASQWRRATAALLRHSVVKSPNGFEWSVPNSEGHGDIYTSASAATSIFPFISADERRAVATRLADMFAKNGIKSDIPVAFVLYELAGADLLYHFLRSTGESILLEAASNALASTASNDKTNTDRLTDTVILGTLVDRLERLAGPQADLRRRLKLWEAANPVSCTGLSDESVDGDFIDIATLQLQSTCTKGLFERRTAQWENDLGTTLAAGHVSLSACGDLNGLVAVASPQQLAAVGADVKRVVDAFRLADGDDPEECGYTFGHIAEDHPGITLSPDPALIGFLRSIVDSGSAPTLVSLQGDDYAALLLAASDLDSNLGSMQQSVEGIDSLSVRLATALVAPRQEEMTEVQQFSDTGSAFEKLLVARVLLRRSNLCESQTMLRSASAAVDAAGAAVPANLQELAGPLAALQRCGHPANVERDRLVTEAMARLSANVSDSASLTTFWDAAIALCLVGHKPAVNMTTVIDRLSTGSAIDVHGGVYDVDGATSPSLTFELADLFRTASSSCRS